MYVMAYIFDVHFFLKLNINQWCVIAKHRKTIREEEEKQSVDPVVARANCVLFFLNFLTFIQKWAVVFCLSLGHILINCFEDMGRSSSHTVRI